MKSHSYSVGDEIRNTEYVGETKKKHIVRLVKLSCRVDFFFLHRCDVQLFLKIYFSIAGAVNEVMFGFLVCIFLITFSQRPRKNKSNFFGFIVLKKNWKKKNNERNAHLCIFFHLIWLRMECVKNIDNLWTSCYVYTFYSTLQKELSYKRKISSHLLIGSYRLSLTVFRIFFLTKLFFLLWYQWWFYFRRTIVRIPNKIWNVFFVHHGIRLFVMN